MRGAPSCAGAARRLVFLEVAMNSPRLPDFSARRLKPFAAEAAIRGNGKIVCWRFREGPAGRGPPKKQTAALPFATSKAPGKAGVSGTGALSVTLLRAAHMARLADYFRFAFRFFFFAAFFFDVLRAGFFAAILRTVVAFFLLFGMNNSL